MEQQSKSLERISSGDLQQKKSVEDLERVNSLLLLDKQHLNNELELLRDRVNSLNREAEADRARALALDIKNAQLTDQVLTLQLTARSGFDERMESELKRIR